MTSCKNCKQQFEVLPHEAAFLTKMDVPKPRLCPMCRRQRMTCWRNQRTLHSGRVCSATKKPLITVFAPNKNKADDYIVYDRDYWWSDKWDPLDFGQEIDFGKTFNEQFNELLHRVPMAAVYNGQSENSLYSNHIGRAKDCYLSFASWIVENMLYCDLAKRVKDSLDLLGTIDTENSYQLINCSNCFNVKFSCGSENCNDAWFLYDCKNCTNCIGCVNLRNKQFCILNKQYTQSEYEKVLGSLALNTRDGQKKLKEKFNELLNKSIRVFAKHINCQDSTGDGIKNLSNCQLCFNLDEAQDSAYCINGGFVMKDVYDGYGIGEQSERLYYSFDNGVKGNDNICCGIVWGCAYAYYSYNCHNCFEIFGCSGVRGKKYCILNKAYTKDEYDKLKAKLISHMKETGEWGEFMDPKFSPFGYNETLGHEYVPLTREQALASGFKWQDNMPGTRDKGTLEMNKVAQRITDVNDSILKEVLTCQKCSTNYKVVPAELNFYKKHDLPVPLHCPNCRYQERLTTRLPHWLWKRECQCHGTASVRDTYRNAASHFHGQEKCPNSFETPFAPDRPEIVYCEKCYQSEVI